MLVSKLHSRSIIFILGEDASKLMQLICIINFIKLHTFTCISLLFSVSDDYTRTVSDPAVRWIQLYTVCDLLCLIYLLQSMDSLPLCELASTTFITSEHVHTRMLVRVVPSNVM